MKRFFIAVCEMDETAHFANGARTPLFGAPLYKHAHRKIMDAVNKLGLSVKFISVDVFDEKSSSQELGKNIESGDFIAIVSPLIFLAPSKVIEDAIKCILNNKFTYATIGIHSDYFGIFGFGEMVSREQVITNCADFEDTIQDSGAVYTRKMLMEKEKATPVTRLDYYKKIEEYRNELLDYLIMSGVDIENRDGVVVSPTSVIRSGTKILPNTQIYEGSLIKAHSVIGPNTVITHSEIGEDVKIENSKISNSVILDGVTVEGYSDISDNCQIGEDAIIKNGCTIKNSEIGARSVIYSNAVIVETKAGAGVMFGSNSVTVKNVNDENHIKTYQCRIGNNAIIGCNSSLIAPIELGDNALVAAGSTITDSVPTNAFAIAREFQENKENRAKKRKRF